jgi:hypothetical protein
MSPIRYLRALAAIYIRLTFRAVDVYELLEPLLKDYRKLRLRDMGSFFHFSQGHRILLTRIESQLDIH